MKASLKRNLLLLALSSFVMLPWAASQTVESASTGAAVAAAMAPAAVPPLVPYSGTALDTQGRPLPGPTSITFLIFKDQTGGEPLFAETQSVALDPTGHYKANLGATLPSGLPQDLFSTGEARWLEVQVAGEAPHPRVLLASVPYAMKAGDAATLGGLPVSAFALAGSTNAVVVSSAANGVHPNIVSNVTTTGGTAGYMPEFNGTATIVDSPVFVLGSDIGIGTTTPKATLDVDGTVKATSYDLGGTLFDAGSASRQDAYLGFSGNTGANDGGGNTGVGYHALLNNMGIQYPFESISTDNTAIGSDALFSNTTGNFNVASGNEALYSNTTGGWNTADGESALYSNTTGSNNTAVGLASGPDLNSHNLSNTTALGAHATVSQNNSTALGANAYVSQSNSLVLGQTTGSPGASHVNVGIGTAAPRSEMEMVIDAASALGPVLTLTNPGGNSGAAAAIDFNTYLPSTKGKYNPAARIAAIDDNWADDIVFQANKQGAPNQGIKTTMTIYPDGDVVARGTLSAAAKAFKIDHPLDPANKYLVHSSVESAEMLNIYTGNVVTDELGLATVKLPDWFEAENTDFRYQLTVIGQFAQAIIKDKIANGQFRIMTNASHVEVSWLVTGVRQDAYAKAHPLVIEEEKPASERGHYTHPELYGQPVDKQIGGHAHDQPASAVNKQFPVPAAPVHARPQHPAKLTQTISQSPIPIE
jgi:hypothetical protein